MKKITVILVVLLLICAMSTLSFAQTSQAKGAKKAEVSTEVVRGKIISIDKTKNEIVVKENKTGTEKTIAVDPKLISSLKANEEVRVTLKAGSNIAEKVKKITKHAASTQKSSK
jgi:hypothetical protein